MVIFKTRFSFKAQLQFRLIGYGVAMLILWMMMPSLAGLANSTYPESISEIDTADKLLIQLQHQNEVLTKTTRVVHFMILITIFWLLTVISAVIKNMKLEQRRI